MVGGSVVSMETMHSSSVLPLLVSSRFENISSRIIIPFVLGIYAVYYLVSARSRPKVYARPSKLSQFFTKYMESVREVYTPFIWGFTGRMQTLLRPIFKRVRKLNYEEEMVSLSDGGEMKLSWYSETPNDDLSCPIALVLPGLTGCSCSHYIATIVRSIAQQGYRCVVLNNRGTCEQKLKTPRTYSASDTEDVSEVISLIHSRYPDAPLTAVGISLGALILFNYISSFGEAVSTSKEAEEEKANELQLTPKMENGGKKCPLRAGMCISMLWKLGESSASLEKPLDWLLFNRPLTNLLCQIVHRNAEVLSDKFDVPRVLRSRSVREFDENLTVDMFGYSSVEEYYNQASPATKVDTIKVPLLCFVAADDPFVPLSTMPLDTIAQSSHVMLVLTKHGGHIGFLDSLLPTGPNLMDRAAAQFCSAVFENLEELSAAARDQTATASESTNQQQQPPPLPVSAS